MKKFRHYLLGQKFKLFTDHRPLLWLKEQKLDGMLGRWALSLQDFDFSIHHVSGKDNILADAVSRQAIAAVSLEPIVSEEYLAEQQIIDPCISAIRQSLLEGDTSPRLPNHISVFLKKRWNQLYPQLQMTHNVVHRYFKREPTGKIINLPVIPNSMQTDIIKMCHDPPVSAHLGLEKTLARVMTIGYWPGIRKSVLEYIQSCKSCNQVKAAIPKLLDHKFTSSATAPGELLTADILKLPMDKGFIGILLIVDSFSKFPVAYKLRSETAKSIQPYFLHYFSHFGIPQTLLTDQGTNFESILLSDMSKYFGVKKLRTTSYHPQTDGQTERMNRSLIEMLRHYAANGKWVDYLDFVLMAYRTSVNSVTGQTPALLFLGREIQSTPVFQAKTSDLPNLSEWADILDQVDLQKSHQPQKEVSHSFKPGQRVMARRHVRESKLQPRFDLDWTILEIFEGCVKIQKDNIQKTVNISDIVAQI